MLRVFLIEDAPRIRALLIEVLQALGRVEVVGFADSQGEALKQLRAIAWDVAIVDIGLSEGTGLAVLDALKRDGRDYGVRFVFTNYPSPALRDRTLALGATEFFDKSHEMDKLIGRVREMAH